MTRRLLAAVAAVLLLAACSGGDSDTDGGGGDGGSDATLIPPASESAPDGTDDEGVAPVEPTGDLKDAITRDFGSYDAFREEWKTKGLGQFGSGWAWLVLEGGKLSIEATSNAETPVTSSGTPLLTMDVWEHAYYIDHRNDRGKFIDVWLEKLVSWDEATARLKGA